jgi:3-oxoacyl-[acyl-carrier-protein] synthase II
VTIVVTGLGAVTALGKTARETFARLLEGERGFRELTLFDPGEVKTRLVAEVSGLQYAPDPLVSRTSELALIAARAAIDDAGLDLRARRVGLVLGGTTAGMLETESVLATLYTAEDAARAQALNPEREAALARMLSHPLSAPTDRIVLELGPFARARSLSSACSSGANALAVGATWLELGLVDAVVCGGADSLCRVTLSGFNALATLDPNGARPFDVRRRGLTLGEGAALVVLEHAEDAHARGKAPVCTLLGWSSRSEAHHITNPEASGEAPFCAMSAALGRAGLHPSDVDYVNAHGTGTPLNDSMESRALARLFGHDLLRVPVSSQKGMIGHTLGAAGAIEAVITALAIEAGVVPPTGGLEEPDPECALRHVMRAERRAIRAALSSSFGFGGMDTVLVLGAPDRAAPPRPQPRSVVVTGIAAVTSAGVFAGEEVADLPERAAGSSDGMVALPAGALDEERARRLDRVSRIAAVACGRALGAPNGERAGADARDAGIVLGIAFGAVDATAEFMRRLRDKGARMVRPADFPSLVPSSPAGHVSIYLGLGGPALVVADLTASGECAIAQAWELIAVGEMDRACAGAVEERSTIVEAVLAVTFGGEDASRRGVARGECGAVLALARAGEGVPALARLGDVHVWRDGPDGAERGSVPRLPPPPEGAVVVLGGVSTRAEELVEATMWGACPRVVCAPTCGANEAAGGVAAAVAAAKVARGDAPAALFVGSARGWAYAGTVWPPEHAGGPAP